VPRDRKRAPSTSPSALADEQRHRQLSDEELQGLVEIYLARALGSPAPDFGEVEALLTESWRRGNQDAGRTAMRSMVPLRTVNGEEIGSLLRSHAELQEVLIAAGKELKSRGAPPLILNYLRTALRQAREVAKSFDAIRREKGS
jgi:hypothetical protein